MQSKEFQFRVAIQGIHGCFHEEAAIKFFSHDRNLSKNNLEFEESETFEELVNHVILGHCDYGIMAIENTLAGSLMSNYNLLTRCNLKICGEVYLHISMHLLGVSKAELNCLTEVYSHPIALAQSRKYLDEDLKLKKIEYFDTAAAAKKIKEDGVTNRSALAGEYAASFYGLKILKRNVETHKHNHTRFLIITREEEVANSDKASIYLELSHEVGSLNRVLNVFEEHDLNLTKIQSSPIEGKPFEYYFHIDLTWDNEVNFKLAIGKAEKFTDHLKVLGCYKRSSAAIL